MTTEKRNNETPWKEERKVLVVEAKRLHQQVKTLQTKVAQGKQRNSEYRTHVLALLQANRMMADIIKAYADREAAMMATLRTLHQAFEPAPNPVSIDLDDE